MLTVERCKKYLKGSNYADKDVEEIRNSLYQTAEILIEQYVKDKNNDNRKASQC